MDFFDRFPQNFYLFSKSEFKEFSYHSDDHSLEKAVEDAFERIKIIEGGNVCAIYQFEQNTIDVMKALASEYKEKYPSIQQLPAFFKHMNDGEYFIRHQKWAPKIDLKRSAIKLDALVNGRDAYKEDLIFFQNWGRLYLMYDAVSYGFLPDNISEGEDDPEKRVCRFCGCSGSEHFKHKSHTIQEALGNHRLICNEECDECNDLFAREVEPHLFKLLEINRTLSDVTGKGKKNHSLEGLNFHIHPDPETKRPIVYVKNEGIVNDAYKGKPTGKINLYNNAKISYNGVYKTLLKIAIDMIPKDKVCHFVNCAKYAHGDFESTDLPPFYYGEHNAFFDQPVIDMFFRNEKSPKYSPFCTIVLYILDSVFIYTLPFCDLDRAFTTAEYKAHIDIFKKYEYLYVKEWEELDSNDKELKTPFYKLFLFEDNPKYKLEFRPSTDPIFDIVR